MKKATPKRRSGSRRITHPDRFDIEGIARPLASRLAPEGYAYDAPMHDCEELSTLC